MRYGVLVFFFILCTLFACGQDDALYVRDSIDLQSVKRLVFNFDSVGNAVFHKTLPFKKIRVEDVRFDTSKITSYSYAVNKFLAPEFVNTKITYEGTTGEGLTTYFNNFYAANENKNVEAELVCFLKKLSCSRLDTFVDNDSYQSKFGKITIQVEAYLHSGDAFYPALKIDTTLTEAFNIKKEKIATRVRDILLMPALQLLQGKIENTNWDKVITRESRSEQEVQKHYREDRFKLPILSQPYKKGIYKTVKEFIANEPSITEFTVENGKLNTIFLRDKGGDNLPAIHLFGYCDGKICWLLRGVYRYPLVRTGNCFNYFITYNKLKILETILFYIKDER